MSVFTPPEIEYLRSQRLGRLATVDPDGRPHVIPVTYSFNEDEDAIDVGGMNFGEGKKWRDAQGNPKVTLLVDDVIPSPRRARAVEVRGDAELHDAGGDKINPRFTNFDQRFFRIRPRRIVSWGLDEGGTTGKDFKATARNVV